VSLAPELRLSDWEQRLLHDPQTSGGLLIAVDANTLRDLVDRLHAAGEAAHVIGEAETGQGELRVR
jgi:selenophosphate synthase